MTSHLIIEIFFSISLKIRMGLWPLRQFCNWLISFYKNNCQISTYVFRCIMLINAWLLILTKKKYSLTKGYNYRRPKRKPKKFTAFEKRRRYLFALNNIDNDFQNTVCIDESSIWAMRQGLYHHRRPKTCPKANAIHPPNPEKVHI